MRKVLFATVTGCLLLLSGCFSATMSQFGAIGSNFKVTVYSGIWPVKVYHTNGKVLAEQNSDGWYFTDRKTGKLVRVSGTVVAEQE